MFNFMVEHTDELIQIITGIVTVASLVAALTPTPQDDSIMAKIRKLVDFLALNIANAKKS
ncbi:MAG TPA: hypothetical protein DCW68_02550 [Rhodospirillaceae bacterium]|nr:MAG: hypothetical protein A2018_05525 [Alphaproteobacteria bacterium GWF2_58_20]HAU28974.1 hypothetical protein [Rhodospirillaceae bacterium]